MKLVNSVQLPAADNLGQEAVSAAEIRQVPNCIGSEVVRGIVVRRATLSVIVNRIGLVSDDPRSFRRNLVERLAPSVKNVSRNPVPKAVFKLRVEGVET